MRSLEKLTVAMWRIARALELQSDDPAYVKDGDRALERRAVAAEVMIRRAKQVEEEWAETREAVASNV